MVFLKLTYFVDWWSCFKTNSHGIYSSIGKTVWSIFHVVFKVSQQVDLPLSQFATSLFMPQCTFNVYAN